MIRKLIGDIFVALVQPSPCKWFHKGPLVYGTCLMGDAIICLHCGREKYEEHWTEAEVEDAKTRQFSDPHWNKLVHERRKSC